MKNRIIIILLLKLFFLPAFAENLKIESKKISIDKKKEVTIFEEQVIAITEDNNRIESNYAELNKKSNYLVLKDKVKLEDSDQNYIETDYAEYNKNSRVFKSKGLTKITTAENYFISGEDIIFDNKNKTISSNSEAIMTDSNNNRIYLQNFQYDSSTHIFKAIGYVKIDDNLNNSYEFSQIYIDTKKKEIVGTDIKAYLNQDSFKSNEKNKPRIFSNAIKLNKNKSIFQKSNFTLCDFRENDKCPPWEIRSSKMLHDSKKKTIYYDNALIKIYNIPIFYFPKISHPDPSVDRRSGFLPPSYSDTKNLGEGISLPYFFNLGKDKNFTLTNEIYLTENPLFLGEYHQAFKNSFLMADFGYTAGYKKTTVSKKAGEKSHFFSKYSKEFVGQDNSKNSIEISTQEVSNDKYLKLYKIKSNLVDFNANTLENSIAYTKESENSFLGVNASLYETLNETYNDKYEYIFPEITYNKNLFNDDKLGFLDFQSNTQIHNYDTNKTNKFLVNDFNWNKDFVSSFGIQNKILGHVKNINYESKNVNLYKNDPTSELFGAAGLLTSINLEKNIDKRIHTLTPKVFLRYAPGSMRKQNKGKKLGILNAYSIDRLPDLNNFETGLSSTLGFKYSISENDKNKFDFSIAQIINSEENKNMPSKTSLDEKLSDLVGQIAIGNEKSSFSYGFNIDQNYKEFNYNELSASYDFNFFKVNLEYLKEQKHIGDQEYLKTKLDLFRHGNNQFSFNNKRDLITNSSEFYNLSYEYINDCLRAGLVYRREFYNDSEIEAENSLMFKITLSPFGDINFPSFRK